jgi:sugar-phosphatase
LKRHLISDFDGVLVDSTPVVEDAWSRWAGERGVVFETMLPRLHGRPGQDVVREFAPHLNADEELAVIDEYELAGTDAITVMPGALELIEAAGPRWAIATSGSHPVATARLRAVGIPVPPVLVTATDITHGKPHPEPYLKAAAGLGVAPADCLVVEDAPAGIAAGKAAGMTVFAVANTHSADVLGAADAIYATTADVIPALRAWLGTRGPEPRSP